VKPSDVGGGVKHIIVRLGVSCALAKGQTDRNRIRLWTSQRRGRPIYFAFGPNPGRGGDRPARIIMRRLSLDNANQFGAPENPPFIYLLPSLAGSRVRTRKLGKQTATDVTIRGARIDG
jgi:hypothetical protein